MMDIVERLSELIGKYDEYGAHEVAEQDAVDEILALRNRVAELQAKIEELKRPRIPAWVNREDREPEPVDVRQNPEPEHSPEPEPTAG